MRPSLVLLSICLLLHSGLSAQNITAITPDHANVNDPITIKGTGFGTAPGTVTVGGKGATCLPENWQDTSIIISVPTGAQSGDVEVTVAGGGKAHRALVVKSPGYDESGCEVMTGVGA